MSKFRKGLIYFLHNGPIKTAQKVWLWHSTRDRYRDYLRSLASASVEEVFFTVYRENLWSAPESKSGSGSTLRHTARLREALRKIVVDLDIHTVFDAPCGDLNWIVHTKWGREIQYIGTDIVAEIIANNQLHHASPSRRFYVSNLLQDAFPEADLWICRDCLFHFSYAHILAALENFARSQIPYMITTTHIPSKEWTNRDIRTGDFRPIDLFSAPFCLPREVSHRVPDSIPGELAREMCVWHRDQVLVSLPKLREVLALD
jgi:hypothetical protein